MPNRTVYCDRGRRRVLLAVGAAFAALTVMAVVGADTTDDKVVVGGSLALLASMFLLAARTSVVATPTHLVIHRMLGWSRIPWSDIGRFDVQRTPGKFGPVPVAILQDGRRRVLYGLDSVFSGLGARSPEWDRTIRELSSTLADHQAAERRPRHGGSEPARRTH